MVHNTLQYSRLSAIVFDDLFSDQTERKKQKQVASYCVLPCPLTDPKTEMSRFSYERKKGSRTLRKKRNCSIRVKRTREQEEILHLQV